MRVYVCAADRRHGGLLPPEPSRDGVRKAAEMGAQGLQVYAVSGEMAPENMTADKRREFLDLVRSSGLRISALCGDLGQGFADREKNPR